MLPTCNMCGVQLEETNEPRIWRCPVGYVNFEVEVEESETAIMYDKYENAFKQFKIKPLGKH